MKLILAWLRIDMNGLYWACLAVQAFLDVKQGTYSKQAEGCHRTPYNFCPCSHPAFQAGLQIINSDCDSTFV